jgi:hypothetical protein
VELDVKDTEVSPGVRRMLAMLGAAVPFEHGRQQIEILAGLEVTAKAVERTAEAIGGESLRASNGRSSAPCSPAA